VERVEKSYLAIRQATNDEPGEPTPEQRQRATTVSQEAFAHSQALQGAVHRVLLLADAEIGMQAVDLHATLLALVQQATSKALPSGPLPSSEELVAARLTATKARTDFLKKAREALQGR